jgi:hypothetical protein
MTDNMRSETVTRVGSRIQIDAERCPTCNEERFVMLRGKRVACPTCCSTIRHGELYVAADNRGQARRSAILLVVGLATGLLALWSGLLTLH